MNLLLICDDLWHPGEVVVRGLKFLEKHGYVIDTVMDAKDILTPEMLRKYDVIVNAKSDALTGANSSAAWFDPGVTLTTPADFRAYVEEGGALMVLHAGTVFSPEKCGEMTSLIGCYFEHHPKQCPVSVKITNPSHPVCEGAGDFSFIQDEHYHIRFTDDDHDIFCEAVSEHGAQPAGYTRKVGKGRICVLTPGHNLWVFDEPGYRKLILGGLEWVMKKR